MLGLGFIPGFASTLNLNTRLQWSPRAAPPPQTELGSPWACDGAGVPPAPAPLPVGTPRAAPVVVEPVDDGVGLEVELEGEELDGLLGGVGLQLVSLLQRLLLLRRQHYSGLLDLQEAQVLGLQAGAGALGAGSRGLAVGASADEAVPALEVGWGGLGRGEEALRGCRPEAGPLVLAGAGGRGGSRLVPHTQGHTASLILSSLRAGLPHPPEPCAETLVCLHLPLTSGLVVSMQRAWLGPHRGECSTPGAMPCSLG